MKQKPQIPTINQVVEITARHCSDKVQPNMKVGARYIVVGIDKLADGTPVLILAHPKRKKRFLRVNAQRFDWRIITKEIVFEETLKKESEDSAKQLQEQFSTKEQLSIAFVPLIYNHLAWRYAEKARRLSADYRIEVLKKLCRAFDHVKTEYRNEIGKDLDFRHIKHFESECDRFMEEYQNQFTIIYYTVNNTFRRLMPNYPYDDLRTNAIMAMMFIKQCDKHNKNMDRLIAERVGSSRPSIRMPIMDKLYSIADAFAGEVGKFDYDDFNIKNCMNLIGNKISEMEFDVL